MSDLTLRSIPTPEGFHTAYEVTREGEVWGYVASAFHQPTTPRRRGPVDARPGPVKTWQHAPTVEELDRHDKAGDGYLREDAVRALTRWHKALARQA